MQPAGWYPDPSGQPNSFRFWDGQGWSQVVTSDPSSPWPQPHELGGAGANQQGFGPGQGQAPNQPGQGQPGQGQPGQGQPGQNQPGQGMGGAGQQGFGQGLGQGSQPLGSQPLSQGGQPMGGPGTQPLGGHNQPGPPGTQPLGSANQPPAATGVEPEKPTRSLTPIVVVAAVLVLAIIGGIIWYANSGSSTPDPQPTAPTAPNPAPTQGGGTPGGQTPGGSTPGENGQLNCSGGNGNQTRTSQPTYSSTGVSYEAVPGWSFAFSRTYWTYLDDYSAMGRTRIDGDKDKNAGIILGGLNHRNGFADQATAGDRVLECYEGTLASEGKTEHSELVHDDVTLGGMKARHTRTMLSGKGIGEKPMQLDVYVIDSQQPTEWAVLMTMQTADTPTAQSAIDKAVSTVRRG